MQKNNNFDILRLGASLGVFFEHGSFVFDRQMVGFFNNNYSFGSLSVFIFFFISGHLVFQSLKRSENLINFFSKRFFRIFPGLFFASLFSVFVVGLWMTSIEKIDFLTSEMVWITFLNYISAIAVHHQLPGVFDFNPFPFTVNASLWTIKYEILMYFLLVVAVFFIGERRWKFGIVIVFSVFLFLLLPEFFWLYDLFYSKDFWRFGIVFFIGVVFVFFPLRKKNFILLLIILGFLISYFGQNFYLVSLGVFIWLPALVFWIAYCDCLKSLKLPFDLSYGFYIYAFPVQQAMTEICLSYGFDKWVCLSFSFVIVFICAWISWVFIEKPAISWSRKKFM